MSRFRIVLALTASAGLFGCSPSTAPPPANPTAPAAQPDPSVPDLPGGDVPQTGSCDFPHEREVIVDSAGALSSALDSAAPGTLIRLRPGHYPGRYKATVSGSSGKHIVLCGSREAILDGGSVDSGYVFHLSGADYWVLSGFTVTRGKKGLMLDDSSHNLLTGLRVHAIGEEAIHLRKFSSGNVVSYSEILDTGKLNPGFGEGVYIGSALNHWGDMTGSGDTPDRSDGNRVLNNVFGPGIAAEHIDIKEGTTGGEIRGNVFNGAGISGANYADSWMDVKGNHYLIADNTGYDARTDGIQLHVRRAGWGNDNVFANNLARVNGPGYGFNIDASSSGNRVLCDNTVERAASGFANVDCDTATGGTPDGDGVPPEPEQPPPQGGLNGDVPPSGNFDLSKWYLTLPSGSTVQPKDLSNGYSQQNVFYTDRASGGMVFRCPNRAGTTANSSYSRTELREMLAGGGSAKDNANNWTTSDGGTLKATLRVDHVSTTGESAKIGRVVIGQIHGADSEPIRLYYRKLPGEAKGRIYAAHDSASNANSYSPDIVGNEGGGGIALGEIFSYEIRLVDTRLTVVIRRASGSAVSYAKDIDPAYRGENLYFKAGVYNQNNTGDSADYVQATFFELSHMHP